MKHNMQVLLEYSKLELSYIVTLLFVCRKPLLFGEKLDILYDRKSFPKNYSTAKSKPLMMLLIQLNI